MKDGEAAMKGRKVQKEDATRNWQEPNTRLVGRIIGNAKTAKRPAGGRKSEVAFS